MGSPRLNGDRQQAAGCIPGRGFCLMVLQNFHKAEAWQRVGIVLANGTNTALTICEGKFSQGRINDLQISRPLAFNQGQINLTRFTCLELAL